MELTLENAGSDTAGRNILMVSVKEIGPSPFGPEVNPPATAEEDQALRESIRENDIQVPLTVGRLKGWERLRVIKGTRRLRMAQLLGIEKVPAEVKEYISIEEARQDALRDNLERRQLSWVARAALANRLWISFETAADKRDKAAQGLGPRKRAAVASGVSEGTLASFRYVLDGGDADLINAMMSGKPTIDAAYRLAKQRIEGGKAAGGKEDLSARMRSFIRDLDSFAAALKGLPALAKRAEQVMGSAARGKREERDRLAKKTQAAAGLIAAPETTAALEKLRLALAHRGAEMADSPPAAASSGIHDALKNLLRTLPGRDGEDRSAG